MNGILRLIKNVFAYADVPATSNPKRKFFDWAADRSYPVANPKGLPYTIAPGASQLVFSGVRATSFDNTTQLSLTASPLGGNRYRFTWSGGTNPALRAARSLPLSTHLVTVTVNAQSQVATWASTPGDWTAVQVGDTVFVPGLSTGDAVSVFNPLNEGAWVVLSVVGDGSSAQLARPAGAAFSAYAEAQTPPSNAYALAYSAAGVQAGDSAYLSVGFAAPVAPAFYQVAAVTDLWFEVIAAQAMPAVTGNPTAAGIVFYSAGKRWVRVEVDQLCAVQANGDATALQMVAPWAPGDSDNTGEREVAGPCWSLTLVNLSNNVLNAFVAVAE